MDSLFVLTQKVTKKSSCIQGTLPTFKASALKNLTSLNCLIIKDNGYEQFLLKKTTHHTIKFARQFLAVKIFYSPHAVNTTIKARNLKIKSKQFI